MKVDPKQLSAIEGQLKEAMARRREADAIYSLALKQAIRAGLSNTKIARTVGVSETAIRTWRKRHVDSQ